MADTNVTSVYIGTTSTLLAPFFIVGPLLAGVVAPLLGYTVIFVVTVCLAATSIVLAFRIREPRKHDASEWGSGDVLIVGQPGAQP